MSERALLIDLEFAVGRFLSSDADVELWYNKMREAHQRLTVFRMEKKYVHKTIPKDCE